VPGCWRLFFSVFRQVKAIMPLWNCGKSCRRGAAGNPIITRISRLPRAPRFDVPEKASMTCGRFPARCTEQGGVNQNAADASKVCTRASRIVPPEELPEPRCRRPAGVSLISDGGGSRQ